jgi:hypothetical protein
LKPDFPDPIPYLPLESDSPLIKGSGRRPTARSRLFRGFGRRTLGFGRLRSTDAATRPAARPLGCPRLRCFGTGSAGSFRPYSGLRVGARRTAAARTRSLHQRFAEATAERLRARCQFRLLMLGPRVVSDGSGTPLRLVRSGRAGPLGGSFLFGGMARAARVRRSVATSRRAVFEPPGSVLSGTGPAG